MHRGFNRRMKRQAWGFFLKRNAAFRHAKARMARAYRTPQPPRIIIRPTRTVASA